MSACVVKVFRFPVCPLSIFQSDQLYLQYFKYLHQKIKRRFYIRCLGHITWRDKLNSARNFGQTLDRIHRAYNIWCIRMSCKIPLIPVPWVSYKWQRDNISLTGTALTCLLTKRLSKERSQFVLCAYFVSPITFSWFIFSMCTLYVIYVGQMKGKTRYFYHLYVIMNFQLNRLTVYYVLSFCAKKLCSKFMCTKFEFYKMLKQ